MTLRDSALLCARTSPSSSLQQWPWPRRSRESSVSFHSLGASATPSEIRQLTYRVSRREQTGRRGNPSSTPHPPSLPRDRKTCVWRARRIALLWGIIIGCDERALLVLFATVTSCNQSPTQAVETRELSLSRSPTAPLTRF